MQRWRGDGIPEIWSVPLAIVRVRGFVGVVSWMVLFDWVADRMAVSERMVSGLLMMRRGKPREVCVKR